MRDGWWYVLGWWWYVGILSLSLAKPAITTPIAQTYTHVVAAKLDSNYCILICCALETIFNSSNDESGATRIVNKGRCREDDDDDPRGFELGKRRV
jgi:hypothetical protein